MCQQHMLVQSSMPLTKLNDLSDWSTLDSDVPCPNDAIEPLEQ